MTQTSLSKFISNYEGETKLANLLERYLKDVFPDHSLEDTQSSFLINTHEESKVTAFLYDTLTDQFTIKSIEEKEDEVKVSIETVISTRTTGRLIEDITSSKDKETKKRQGMFVYDHGVPLNIELLFDPTVYLENHNLPPALMSHQNLVLNNGEDVKIDAEKIGSASIEWETI